MIPRQASLKVATIEMISSLVNGLELPLGGEASAKIPSPKPVELMFSE